MQNLPFQHIRTTENIHALHDLKDEVLNIRKERRISSPPPPPPPPLDTTSNHHAPPPPPPPKIWEKYYSEEHDTDYYYNTVNGETLWEQPPVPDSEIITTYIEFNDEGGNETVTILDHPIERIIQEVHVEEEEPLPSYFDGGISYSGDVEPHSSETTACDSPKKNERQRTGLVNVFDTFPPSPEPQSPPPQSNGDVPYWEEENEGETPSSPSEHAKSSPKTVFERSEV